MFMRSESRDYVNMDAEQQESYIEELTKNLPLLKKRCLGCDQTMHDHKLHLYVLAALSAIAGQGFENLSLHLPSNGFKYFTDGEEAPRKYFATRTTYRKQVAVRCKRSTCPEPSSGESRRERMPWAGQCQGTSSIHHIATSLPS